MPSRRKSEEPTQAVSAKQSWLNEFSQELPSTKSGPYPSASLFQINTRVWLTELSRGLGRPATLDDIPDAELDRLAVLGFDWVWVLSAWQTGLAGQHVSRSNPQWLMEFDETLPDLREEDIAGSGFAITGYSVHPLLGGAAALARLRERLRERGMKLMLDFVPNHTGLDHPWVQSHPEYYVSDTPGVGLPWRVSDSARREIKLRLIAGAQAYDAGDPHDQAGAPTTEDGIGRKKAEDRIWSARSWRISPHIPTSVF